MDLSSFSSIILNTLWGKEVLCPQFCLSAAFWHFENSHLQTVQGSILVINVCRNCLKSNKRQSGQTLPRCRWKTWAGTFTISHILEFNWALARRKHKIRQFYETDIHTPDTAPLLPTNKPWTSLGVPAWGFFSGSWTICGKQFQQWYSSLHYDQFHLQKERIVFVSFGNCAVCRSTTSQNLQIKWQLTTNLCCQNTSAANFGQAFDQALEKERRKRRRRNST